MINNGVKVLKYYNDSLILNSLNETKKYAFLITEPPEIEVVLGRSMKLEKDIKIDNCIKDSIKIYRRMGGGGTVVLSKGIIVITVAGISNIKFHFREQMNSVNNTIIDVLKYMGIKNTYINGISDITIGDKKIAGSSFYNSKDIVLYQGSLLYNPDFDLFERYLKHPVKMPEYRKNRPHKDFITSIIKEGYNINKSELIDLLINTLKKRPPWENLLV